MMMMRGRRKSVAKVILFWKNGVKIGTKYFGTYKDAKNFAAVSRGHGKEAHLQKMN